MKYKRPVAVALIAALVTTGCASTRGNFVKNSYKLDKLDFCQNYVKDYSALQKYKANAYSVKDSKDRNYFRVLEREVDRRNVSYGECKAVVKEHEDDVAKGILAAAALIAITAAVANSSGGGGYGSSTSYEWDEFYDAYGNLTWRCRDTSNGQFAYDYNCAGSLKTDSTWPGK
ncbi:hypothetical protein XMD543_000020 [Marinobacterium sp. xm-d-543]|uniref:hypothetical protein n=1 Tax=Marinobacterium sp. xm-d-543 TaxID=2497740 RepID=UPI00156904D6|nr:hypothetical protein [Marinobacterium sp. xm-d-543]NRP46014.1 hypothetical protein [Marinobacterium sp. xm-d-543]